MRKALLVTTLALSLAGCFTQNTAPHVRDLSVSRQAAEGDTVTVKKGDTLYGIAWRQSMDFRQLARLNDIAPPYRLEPGQTLRLNGNGQAGAAPGADAASRDAQLAGAATGAAAASGAPDWLAPDTDAIERNQRLRSQPLESSAPPANEAPDSSVAEQPSNAAVAAATEAGGPIYNYDSPGADGQLSEQDRAEREARRRQPQTTAQAGEEETATAGDAEATAPESQPQSTAAAGAPTPQQGGGEQSTGPDAGTAVAGEIDTKSPERTYEPVANINWQWPTEGQVVGDFDEGTSITAGIDIAGQKGQPVKAAGPGIVVYSGDGVRGYGNLILIKHNDSFLSAYAHNDTLRVEENDVVRTGEVIATMGDTDAENTRLHFEVRQDGQPRDPLKYLPQR